MKLHLLASILTKRASAMKLHILAFEFSR